MPIEIAHITLNNHSYTIELDEHLKDKQTKKMTALITGAIMMIGRSLEDLTDPEFMIGDPTQSYTFVLEKIDHTIRVNAIVPKENIHTL